MAIDVATFCMPCTEVSSDSVRLVRLPQVRVLWESEEVLLGLAAHCAATGRPISRDGLRARLRIGTDRASALVAAVRAETAAATRSKSLPHAA